MTLLEAIQNCGDNFTYNPSNNCYDFYDGTCIAAELLDNMKNGIDLFYIQNIRERQRKNLKIAIPDQVRGERG